MKRLAVALVAIALVAPRVHAKGDKKSDDDDEDTVSTDDDSSDEAPKKKKKGKAAKKDKSDDGDGDGGGDEVTTSDDDDKPANRLAEKQDLTGHDLGSAKKANVFERDRFFVDKVDSDKTAKGTLVQGSITSTSLVYTESGGPLTMPVANGPSNDNSSRFTRLFTDLRLQTDFRHIASSRWDARFDGRIRLVTTPDQQASTTNGDVFSGPVVANHVQSGLTGQNEYDIRELWLVRNGDRSDVFIGRQFIPDLGGLKIDGIRVDYASSKKFTLIGFGGLYPFRGSRSLTTDYIELKDAAGNNAGQFVSTGGFGAAYRTEAAYGSFGGVVIYPLPIGGNPGEAPRVYATSTGYWRYGSQLDLYHFALIDINGSNAVNGDMTNISAGLNYKPSPRLRLTASYNRVDTETLNVQAQAFLASPDKNVNVVQNNIFVTRLATDAVRGGVSAGLGELQRFEISTAVSYRYRPGFTLDPPGDTTGAMATALPAASSVEVYGSIVDRHSVANLRIGADIVNTFAVGSVAFQRSTVLAVRAFTARELASGKGEWEAEVSYASTKDSTAGGMTACQQITDLATCYGASTGTILSIGGTLYYRFSRDLFGIASAFISDTTIQQAMAAKADSSILGLTGFLRAAYRF